MKLRLKNTRAALAGAFSLIEIMVVMGLLTVILLGLMLMFNQTQKAFRTGMTQVDVMEGGRALTEMIARELAQVTPTYRSRASRVVNFYAELPFYSALKQPLPPPSPTIERTNVLEDVFFMKKENVTWTGIGYFVRSADSAGNLNFDGTVGALYRFETNYSEVQFMQTPGTFLRDFNAARGTPPNTPGIAGRVSKVLDGVVHLKVRTFDLNGGWQTQDLPNNGANQKSDIRWSTGVAPGEIGNYAYYSNAVPAYVELELGILESRVAERAKTIPDAAARRSYLENQAGHVHVFRMRVPIRDVDPQAYK